MTRFGPALHDRLASFAPILVLLLVCFGTTIVHRSWAHTLSVAKEIRQETLLLSLKDQTKINAKLKTIITSKQKKKRPALLVFGGFQNAAGVLDLIDPNVDIVLGSFDYPFEPPKEPFRFPESLEHLPAAKATIWNTIEGISALTRKLSQRKDVDPDKISILGASFGSPFAVYSAAASERIKGIVIVHGFGQIKKVVQSQIAHKLTPRLGSFSNAASWSIVETAWKYVGLPRLEHEAKKLRKEQSVIMLQAESDDRIPQSAQASLKLAFEQSKAQFEFRTLPGGHLGPNQPQAIRKLLLQVTRWMRRQKLL